MTSIFLQDVTGTLSVETSSKAVFEVWDLPPPPSPAYKNLSIPHDIERGPVCFIMREHCVCVHGLV